MEEKVKRALKRLRFWRLVPKGEKYSPKQKGPHHHQFQSFFKKEVFNWYLNLFHIGKTLLNTKRRISSRGSFVKSKEKHLKQAEKISNLENASHNLIHIPLTICKKTFKRVSKRLCKNKTSGASVVQNVKRKKAIHAYLVIL
jgi:hypothetical protein